MSVEGQNKSQQRQTKETSTKRSKQQSPDSPDQPNVIDNKEATLQNSSSVTVLRTKIEEMMRKERDEFQLKNPTIAAKIDEYTSKLADEINKITKQLDCEKDNFDYKRKKQIEEVDQENHQTELSSIKNSLTEMIKFYNQRSKGKPEQMDQWIKQHFQKLKSLIPDKQFNEIIENQSFEECQEIVQPVSNGQQWFDCREEWNDNMLQPNQHQEISDVSRESRSGQSSFIQSSLMSALLSFSRQEKFPSEGQSEISSLQENSFDSYPSKIKEKRKTGMIQYTNVISLNKQPDSQGQVPSQSSYSNQSDCSDPGPLQKRNNTLILFITGVFESLPVLMMMECQELTVERVKNAIHYSFPYLRNFDMNYQGQKLQNQSKFVSTNLQQLSQINLQISNIELFRHHIVSLFSKIPDKCYLNSHQGIRFVKSPKCGHFIVLHRQVNMGTQQKIRKKYLFLCCLECKSQQFSYFCRYCFQSDVNLSNQLCNSQKCRKKRQLVLTSPMNKQFNFYVYRFCPYSCYLVKNQTDNKYSLCVDCRQIFCHACLKSESVCKMGQSQCLVCKVQIEQ